MTESKPNDNKLILTVVLDYSEIAGHANDPGYRTWFYRDILKNSDLVLRCESDKFDVGTIRVLEMYVAQPVETTICPGCGTELYDAADKDGLCKDCKPDYDDEDFNNDDTMNYCTNCSGSGEGMHDGTSCNVCNGSGIEKPEREEL